MKADEAVAFIKKHQKNGWVNLNIKTARSGNAYLELDTYEPKQKAEAVTQKVSKPAEKEVLPF